MVLYQNADITSANPNTLSFWPGAGSGSNGPDSQTAGPGGHDLGALRDLPGTGRNL